jgi:glycosyltransferase involved in cell wall biosynthesis
VKLSPDVPVVLAASATWDTPAPVNAHQLARRLAARGHRVLFVESTGLRAPALAAAHDRRRIAARLRACVRAPREMAPGLFVASPLALPGAGPTWLRRASLAALAVQAARAARRVGLSRPVLWAFLPTALELARSLDARLLVYHCVDHYAANPGVNRAWVEHLEARILERAQVVLATSQVLAERLRAVRSDVHLMPNVADVALFSRAVSEPLPEPADLAMLPRPRAVYVGNLAAYRVDPLLLRAAARALGGGSLVLIGAEGLGDAASGGFRLDRGLGPAVARLGPRPQEALPAYLRHCDVALIPFLDNEHTRASLPLKLWEYLAAGLPVVATELPNLRELAKRGLLHSARDAESFAAAVAGVLAEGRCGIAEGVAEAWRHDWAPRIEELCEVVGGALARAETGSRWPGAPS